MNPSILPIKIVLADGGSETVYAEQIDVDTFRLVENPIFSCHIKYGSTVKVEKQENGDLIVSKLVRASDYHSRRFLLSSLQAQRYKGDIGDKILEAGGFWEIAMGGFVFINIPRNSTLNLDQLFIDVAFFPTEVIDDIQDGV